MSFRNLTLALILAVTKGCFAGYAAYAAVTEGEQCTAFIQTAHPGVGVTIPYGSVYRSLGEAQNDALNRCNQTNLAKEGWGPYCRTWCVPVDRQKTAD